jgi:hypothetical protein
VRSEKAIDRRGFRLVLRPVGQDLYEIALEETNGTVGPGSVVVRAGTSQVRQVMPAIADAVRVSGHAKTVLSPHRQRPISLKEEAGVRLGLVLVATQPIAKARRIQEMADAVAGMTSEEVYYWYAKVTGSEGSRLQRSLRLFLSKE